MFSIGLDMANYEENVEIPEPKKYYVAKLVEYSVDSSTGNNTTTATSRTGNEYMGMGVREA